MSLQRSETPKLMTVEDVAALLRTTPKAIYEMHRRRQLPGARRIGRRLLFDRATLLHLARPHLHAVTVGDE